VTIREATYARLPDLAEIVANNAAELCTDIRDAAAKANTEQDNAALAQLYLDALESAAALRDRLALIATFVKE
jgi:hypothetical protein